MKRTWIAYRHALLTKKAIRIAREQIADRITLGKLASQLTVSVAHFSRVFKEQTGMTFSQFIGKEKRRKAERLLHNPELSIKQVALMSGYRNADYFSRRFKESRRKTATEYRNSIKGKIIALKVRA